MADAVSWSLHHLPRQRGRTAVVTGANAGLGLETTRALAALGARVVMACRNLEKAYVAADDVRRSVPGADLDVRPLDLADLASVAAFAETVGDDSLDLLILNAGVMRIPERRETADGFELQFGTNVLGHFALAAHLVDNVLQAPRSRVVWVASIAHRRGRIDLDDLQSRKGYDPTAAYDQSKLADLMLALEMDRRLRARGADTIAAAAHPGVSITELADDMLEGRPILRRTLESVAPRILMPAWKGALPTLVAATTPDVRGGDYVGPQGWREVRGWPGPAEIAPQARDEATAAALWERCEALTGLPMLSDDAS